MALSASFVELLRSVEQTLRQAELQGGLETLRQAQTDALQFLDEATKRPGDFTPYELGRIDSTIELCGGQDLQFRRRQLPEISKDVYFSNEEQQGPLLNSGGDQLRPATEEQHTARRYEAAEFNLDILAPRVAAPADREPDADDVRASQTALIDMQAIVDVCRGRASCYPAAPVDSHPMCGLTTTEILKSDISDVTAGARRLMQEFSNISSRVATAAVESISTPFNPGEWGSNPGAGQATPLAQPGAPGIGGSTGRWEDTQVGYGGAS